MDDVMNEDDKDKKIEFIDNFSNKAWMKTPLEAIGRADELLTNVIEPKYYFDPRIKNFDKFKAALEDKHLLIYKRFDIALNILIYFGIYSTEVKYVDDVNVKINNSYLVFDVTEYDRNKFGKQYKEFVDFDLPTCSFDTHLTSHMYSVDPIMRDDLSAYENI